MSKILYCLENIKIKAASAAPTQKPAETGLIHYMNKFWRFHYEKEVPDRYERFSKIYDYAKVVKRLAQEYDVTFLALQEKFERAAMNSKVEHYLYDGVHPNVVGANLIATEWIKCFKEKVEPL